MPANDNHLLRHHDVFNRNPNSNFNSNPPPRPKPSPKFLSLVLKAIIMVLIISLFFLFLGIAAVAVIHFFLAGGVLHSHRIRRRSTTTPTTQFSVDSSDAAASYSVEDLQRYLPRLKYSAAGLPLNAWMDCAVCLESFKEGDWCLSLPECHHMFHASCVDKWLTKVANCPVCRAPVRLDSEATGSMIGDDHYKLLWAIGV